jgi:hypothetical protein
MVTEKEWRDAIERLVEASVKKHDTYAHATGVLEGLLSRFAVALPAEHKVMLMRDVMLITERQAEKIG